MTVIKRDGTEVPFDGSKIVNAVDMANKRTHTKERELGKWVCHEVLVEFSEINKVSITKIEDAVEKFLKELSPCTYAEFSTYRQERMDNRFKGSDLAQRMEDILVHDENERENGNMSEEIFSGKSSKIAATSGAQYSRTHLIDPEVLKAFDKGVLHIHDFSAYHLGNHNCTTVDLESLLKGGLKIKNGGTREPKTIRVALAQTYLLIGAISQNQFGGCAVTSIDTCLAPYLKRTFYDNFAKTLKLLDIQEEVELKTHWETMDTTQSDMIQKAQAISRAYALDDLDQGMKGFFHDLSGSSAREGSQLSFSSINYGNDTDPDAVLISKSILETRAKGIGNLREIVIFPIGIFQYSPMLHGEGMPLEWLFDMAVESTAKYIYPNYVYVPNKSCNLDWKAKESTMGCRTQNAYDRHATTVDRTGRGNISPITISLPYLALEANGDYEIFKDLLQDALKLTEKGLLDRFDYQVSQKGKNAPFLYENGVLKSDKPIGEEDTVREALKHGSLVFGYLGMAEALVALFGKHHAESEDSYSKALEIVNLISEYASECSDRNDLNFSPYATPAESLCMKARDKAFKEFGEVEGVTDREYFTNSHHIPVYYPITASKKMELEVPFDKIATAGNIMYVEMTGDASDNPKAVKSLIREAMDLEVPYFAVNVPRDTCNNCGYKSYDLEKCPKCDCTEIKQLRRITGYTTSEVKNMNDGKQAEVRDRVKHVSFNNLQSLT